jgi:hypothetical protein
VSRAVHYSKIAVVKVCLTLFVSSVAISAYAQDAPNPVDEFLNAFRGKPVAPVAPPPVSSAAVNGTQAPVSNTNQVSTMAAQADATLTGNPPPCPPGVDRMGCVNTSGQRVRNECPAGMTAGPTGCVPMAMPPNAHRVSADGQWQCDEGYLRWGAICMAMQSTPLNAHLTGTGTNWECNTGFRRVGNMCVAVGIPPNAHFANTWNGWECDSGYRMVGNWCIAH